MLIGLVKWFDSDKGFGVIGTPEGDEFFLHINSFISKPDKILKCTPIVFSPKADKTKNRNSAERSRLVGEAEDWNLILSYWGKADKVLLEENVLGFSRNGNPFYHKKIQSISLVKTSLQYFFTNKNEEEISNIIIDYFDNYLESNQFISYCDLIEENLPKHFSLEKSNIILSNVYSHFGKILNDETLYSVWKQIEDKFNSINEMGDRDISELISKQFTDADKIKITESIHRIIDQKCSDEYKAELWVKGIIKYTSFEFISKYFFDKDSDTEQQLSILLKLETDKQFELLKQYSSIFNYEKTFELLGEYLKEVNSLYININFSEVVNDEEFWEDKKGSELIELLTDYIYSNGNDDQKFELFLNGYIKNVPQNIIGKHIDKLKEGDFKKIFKNISGNNTLIRDILFEKLTIENSDSLSWLFDLAIVYLNKENFKSFDKKVFETISQSEYFNLWTLGKAKIFPENKIDDLLQDKFETYSQINKWIENNTTTSEYIAKFLLSNLQNKVLVNDKIIFYKKINYIRYLLQLDELYAERIKQINNEFYKVILWSLDKENDFDFELLKQKFIYFSPEDQVRIIRKLFSLKAKDQFDLTLEKLNELTRFDLDLYKTNLNFNPEVAVDISTDVVIKALESYQKNHHFFVESELLQVILNDLKFDEKRRFKLSHYFEDCLGRQTAEFDRSTKGRIKKEVFGENQFYFAINFPTGQTEWVNNRWGGREIYSPNPNFEKLKEAVKKIPGVKWNPDKKHWGIPSKNETEVLSFANEYRFFLDFEGSNYSNNTHLAKFKREDVPNGISFCEGRLANKPHEMFKKEFWWCGGQPCFSKCETIHKTEEWEKYTLLDFCEILNLNTDETNRMGDYVPKGHYYKFIALINRFNRLLEKLYCKDCNHILYPSDFGTSHFAAHTIVRFQCRNDACSSKNDEIYLNHCLNGQCNCIIDSRISKRCENGLFICDNCGSCCSHSMLERRLSNLNHTGGYIHQNLIKCVNEKLGHLERGEYFCYKCNSEMTETSKDIFECLKCNIKYDTTKYNFKRPHINLRKTRGTSDNNFNNNERNENEFDFPY